MELKEQIGKIAQLRKDSAFFKGLKAKSFTEWNDKNRELLDKITELESSLVNSENTLRSQAVADYVLTAACGKENKNPIPGIEIKLFQEIRYDPTEAFVWAKEHNLALALDVKAFEKIAKTSPLGFVAMAQIPRAQIASDLSKYAVEEVKPEDR